MEKKKKICLIVLIGLVTGALVFANFWWNTYLIQQAEGPEKPINEFENTAEQNDYYPHPITPTHLYTINMSNLPGEEAVMMSTLMGVLAKGPMGPQIYIEDDGGYYSQYKELIEAENITLTGATDPWALVSQFASNISGYILFSADNEGVQQSKDPILSSDTLTYEHQDESYCVAVSLAGIYNACAVDVEDEAQAQAAGLSMVFDARGKDCEWLFASDQFEQLRKDMIFEVEHHTDRRLFLIDYAVFCGAPVWHAETLDQRAEFLKNFEADSPSFGWGAVGPTDEAGLNMQVTAAGGFFMPSDWARDLSVFAAIPKTCQQKELPELPTESDVHYISFVMSDGDNLQWSMAGLNDTKFFGSDHQGEFAMGWTIPPAMADLCPIILQNYYENAAENNRFVAGVSGHGLIYNSKDPWHEIHVNRSGPVLERADIDVVTIQDFGWQKITFEPTANLEGVTGVIYMDYRQYALQSGKSMWVNDKPCVSFNYNFWKGFDSSTGIALSVNTASKNINSPSAYSLIVVHAWSHGMDDIAELVGSFDEDVRVVDPETFIQLFSQNVPHIDAFSFNFMQFITLFGQYILIILGVAIVLTAMKRGIKKIRGKNELNDPKDPSELEKDSVSEPSSNGTQL